MQLCAVSQCDCQSERRSSHGFATQYERVGGVMVRVRSWWAPGVRREVAMRAVIVLVVFGCRGIGPGAMAGAGAGEGLGGRCCGAGRWRWIRWSCLAGTSRGPVRCQRCPMRFLGTVGAELLRRWWGLGVAAPGGVGVRGLACRVGLRSHLVFELLEGVLEVVGGRDWLARDCKGPVVGGSEFDGVVRGAPRLGGRLGGVRDRAAEPSGAEALRESSVSRPAALAGTRRYRLGSSGGSGGCPGAR